MRHQNRCGDDDGFCDLACCVPAECISEELPAIETAINRRSLPSTLVTKTRSSQTTGVAPPGPGSGILHWTLDCRLQLEGIFFSSETPFPLTPRHCGQLSAFAVDSKRVPHCRQTQKVKTQKVETRCGNIGNTDFMTGDSGGSL